MKRFMLATTIALSTAAPALAQDLHAVDFVLDIENNQIITGAVDTSDGSAVFPVRVKSAVMGAEGFPNFTNDPGFTSRLGDLIPGMTIGFTILAAPRAWNSDDQNFDTFADDTITVRAAGQNIVAPSADTPVMGIVFGQAALDPDAFFHHHMQFLLLDGGLPPTVDGVWLLQLQLWTETSGIAPTDTLYLIFAQGAGEDELQNAIDYVEDELIGSPCIADLNADGTLNFFDVSAFLSAFSAGDLSVDLNSDGVLNFFDVSAFLSAFSAGCP